MKGQFKESVAVLEEFGPALKKWEEKQGKLLRRLSLPLYLPAEVTKFCSDRRRATRNKIAFIEDKLEEYKDYIKNPQPVEWTRYKPLGRA